MRNRTRDEGGPFQAAFIAGSALATVGLSGIEAHGPARWVLVAGGICGLAVLTMAMTYLIEVQEGISRRDAGILNNSKPA